jgi:hypothetical protein
MQTLHALDLTQSVAMDSLWRRTKDPRVEPSREGKGPGSFGLPANGFSSPMGFWFAEAPSWTTDPPPLRVEFFEIADPEQSTRPDDEPARLSSPACRTVRRPKKAPPARARSRELPLPLVIEIDSNVARIGVDPDTWADLRETVLFAVAQYWRLEAIDRALDELSAWARNDLERNSGFASVFFPRRSNELRARRQALEKMILDLPDFEGALTNPRGHLAAAGAVELYRRLCARLALAQRRREIDERIEVVESIFGSLAESLNHYQSLAFQIVLELAIVALLLLDVGLYLVAAFRGHGP